MKKTKYIIFRYLTSADFFNIYKPSGTEIGGGGQSYIDFPTDAISVGDWGKFFDGAASVYLSTSTNGPLWEFPLLSLGLGTQQEIKVYQRRPQSICISSQRITSQQEKRVDSWRPEHGFPKPTDPKERETVPHNLMIYIVRTIDDQFWAGWALDDVPAKTAGAKNLLAKLIANPGVEGYAGFRLLSGLLLDDSDQKQPFAD